jgi:hypothetical protein
MKYQITEESFTRIKSDTNGNPRYVLHFLNLITDEEREKSRESFNGVGNMYEIALRKARKAGGRKYHTKSYGGGIVFQCYNVDSLIDILQQL